MSALLAALVPLAMAPVAWLAARRRARAAADVALLASVAALALMAVAAARGASLELPWVPSWGARLALRADPLGSLLGLLAASVGVLVTIYARAYLPHHLEEHGRPQRAAGGYHALVLLFLASMLALAMARDLVLLFVAFDLTALCSYFLIGFDRDRPSARRAALMALVLTGAGSVAFLIAALILHAHGGSFALDAALAAELPRPAREAAAALTLLAAMVKSAQVPFHFWLPRAMSAPTPVSAFLHSAAMVAAGAFLLLRMEPLVAGTTAGESLRWLGLASILVGSLLALGADVLKQLLAYSTIAQYGYVLLLIGLGGEVGVAGAALYLLAHAVAKSGLFLTAGALTQATGEDRLSRLGGLARRMPALAASALVLSAALAGMPGTVGYFKDEVLFKAALEAGPGFAAAALLAAALTLAYTARFWIGAFVGGAVRPRWGELDSGADEDEADVEGAPGAGAAASAHEGREDSEPHERPQLALVLPVALLALAALVGGAIPAALASVAQSAGSEAAGRPLELHLAYELGAPLWLALGAWSGGALGYLSRRRWMPAARALHRFGARLGPRRVYESGVASLHRLSRQVHAREVRDLRDRVAAILVPAGVLLVAATISVGGRTEWRVGPLEGAHAPLLVALATVAVTALATPPQRTHLGLVLALTAFGYTLAAVYALLGAPDLALVAVLVETVLTLLLLAAFGLLPGTTALRGARATRHPRVERRRRHRAAGAFAGAVAGVFSLVALSAEGEGGVARVQEALSEQVGAKDTVAAILADFRGLDTAGEVTVLALALLGVATLLRRRSAT